MNAITALVTVMLAVVAGFLFAAGMQPAGIVVGEVGTASASAAQLEADLRTRARRG